MLFNSAGTFRAALPVRLENPANEHFPGIERIRSYAAGRTLFHQGEDVDFTYQVISGILRISRVLENGHRQIIAFGLPGDFVGLPHRDKYTGTCDLLTAATLRAIWVHPRDQGSSNLNIRNWLLEAALDEVARLQDHNFMVGTMYSSRRVAVFLCQMMERVGCVTCGEIEVCLPMDRKDMADYLGLRMETVSRGFTKLRGMNLIRLPEPDRVIVLDPVGLREFAIGD
jgi:CRP-like cAMP-binding protein